MTVKKLLLKIIRKLGKIFENICKKNKLIKYDFIGNEHIKNFGNDFSDKTFYIIRRRPPGSGLLSNFHWVLNHTIYATSKGYIPVVNMGDYKTFYNEKKPLKLSSGNTSINAWEYYFEQPCGYSLEDIKNAKNVILGDWDNYLIAEYPSPYGGSKNISEYYELISKYCRFNPETVLACEKKKQLLFGNKKNILGVLYRGTDYKIAKKHNTPASLEQTIEKTRQVLQQEKFDYIFFCTEVHEAIDEFCKAFPQKKVFFSEYERIKNYNNKDGDIPDIIQKSSSSAYQNGFEYITDMILLSQCDGLIAPKVNGTHFALGLNNNQYRYSYIFDFGFNS